jgi:hypothetical protein
MMPCELGSEPAKDQINVCAADWYTADGLAKAERVLPEAWKERVQVFSCDRLGVRTDADYLVVNRIVLQIMKSENRQQRGGWLCSVGGRFDFPGKYQAVASLRAFGSDFITAYSLG